MTVPLTSAEQGAVNELLAQHRLGPLVTFPDPETMREICEAAAQSSADRLALANELAATGKDEDYRNNALALAEALLTLGIVINFPRVTQGKVPEILRLAGRPDSDNSARIELGRFLALETLDPMLRAFNVCQAQRIPHIKDVSHYVDAAAFSFFDGRRLDAANDLIVCVERLLLSHLGWRLGDREAAASELREAIKNLASVANDPLLRSRFRLYRRVLLLFLKEQFQERSKRAAKSGLYGRTLLNRAFILHTNEPGSYYELADLVSLFGFFDLYCELLSHQYETEVIGLLPNEDEDRDRRRRLYWVTLLEDFLDGGRRRSALEAELATNSKYVASTETNLVALEPNGPARNRMIGHGLLLIGKERSLSIIVRAGLDLAPTSETRERLNLIKHLYEGLLRLSAFEKK